MSASFKRIDYSLRPAKHAERRMLCDLFRRLRPFGRIEEYVYVGFGSVWFSDFALIHRSLGVKNMISIEQAESARDRIEDNKPFRIPVVYSNSKDALPNLDWSKNQFLWLDYDDPLTPAMLLDVRTVARRAGSGTVLTVSVQCSKAPQVAQAEQDNSVGAPTGLDRFTTIFGRQRIPHGTKEEQLYGWQFGILSRAILMQEIEAELASRNSDHSAPSMCYCLICEIEYEDGAKMTTFTVLFYSAVDKDKLEQCHFEALDFLANHPTPVRISVPILTPREFRKLESQLPLEHGVELSLGTIPLSEARKFVDMYRYLPNFAVLEG